MSLFMVKKPFKEPIKPQIAKKAVFYICPFSFKILIGLYVTQCVNTNTMNPQLKISLSNLLCFGSINQSAICNE